VCYREVPVGGLIGRCLARAEIRHNPVRLCAINASTYGHCIIYGPWFTFGQLGTRVSDGCSLGHALTNSYLAGDDCPMVARVCREAKTTRLPEA
jgi:hypothetical protein